jgi:hypothetical protein
MLVWGKSLLHAQISEEEQQLLQAMPPVTIYVSDSKAVAADVSYAGSKAGECTV